MALLLFRTFACKKYDNLDIFRLCRVRKILQRLHHNNWKKRSTTYLNARYVTVRLFEYRLSWCCELYVRYLYMKSIAVYEETLWNQVSDVRSVVCVFFFLQGQPFWFYSLYCTLYFLVLCGHWANTGIFEIYMRVSLMKHNWPKLEN